jgi:hypothetical protein
MKLRSMLDDRNQGCVMTAARTLHAGRAAEAAESE